MFFLFEIGRIATLETLAVSVPESVGLLIFGVGLIVAAVLLRSLLAKSDKQKRNEKATKEA